MIGNLVRYGIPLSFVYCTIYQQNIWREGDERLIVEQKRVWRDFFTMIDDAYNTAITKTNLSRDPAAKLNLTAKFDSMNMKDCWNAKVLGLFSSVDKAITNKSDLVSKLTFKFN